MFRRTVPCVLCIPPVFWQPARALARWSRRREYVARQSEPRTLPSVIEHTRSAQWPIASNFDWDHAAIRNDPSEDGRQPGVQGPPWCVFAYFLHKQKVGRRRQRKENLYAEAVFHRKKSSRPQWGAEGNLQNHYGSSPLQRLFGAGCAVLFYILPIPQLLEAATLGKRKTNVYFTMPRKRISMVAT